MLCKTYDESLQKQWIYSVFFFALPIAVTQLKHQNTEYLANLRYILEFLEKNENLEMFTSKQEILRSNGRTRDNLSKQESPIQNGRVEMYVIAILLKDTKSVTEAWILSAPSLWT